MKRGGDRQAPHSLQSAGSNAKATGGVGKKTLRSGKQVFFLSFNHKFRMEISCTLLCTWTHVYVIISYSDSVYVYMSNSQSGDEIGLIDFASSHRFLRNKTTTPI